jgi:hypothetical protein
LRVDLETTAKGYQAVDFQDSWDRYIPLGRETSETGKQTASGQSGEGVQDVSDESNVDETNSECEKADVSAVSLVSVSQGVHKAVDGPEAEEWVEGDL